MSARFLIQRCRLLTLWVQDSSCIEIVLMTDSGRDLLVEHGRKIAFMNGTWTLIEEKIQLITILVKVDGKSFPVDRIQTALIR